MMKVYSELGSKTSTYSEIGLNALYQIATLPPAEREKPHTIPSTGEVKTVDEMTVRELREVKRAQMVVFLTFSYLYKRRVDAYWRKNSNFCVISCLYKRRKAIS